MNDNSSTKLISKYMDVVSLFFAGDFCSKPPTSLISVSEELKDVIQSCDLKVVNFEVPLKPKISLPTQKYERYWQNDDVPDFLRGLGFNLFSMANNHTFDWGDEGFKKTKCALGDQSFGAGSYEEAYKIKVCEVKGIKIGFLALSYAAYTGVFDDALQHDGLGCAYINDLRVNHVIMDAKKQVKYLFVLPHDGVEYIDVPLPETIARYRDFIDYGADGVIASHPHCPQGWEVYKGKPIFYSLGNFFFNSKEDTMFRAKRPHWYEGMCVIIELTDEEINYQIINIQNIENVSITIDTANFREQHNQKLCSYLIDKDLYIAYLFEQCQELCNNQEMPIIDKTIHPTSLTKYIKRSLRNCVKIIRKQEVSNDFPLRTLLRNDTRRSVIMRVLKRKLL
jgi:poly-gamma-glutamate synthesis protein (capsule biosynthesis protein)